MAAVAGHATTAAQPSRLPGRGYRTEIQGLRALAVLMVVAYHVWLGRVSGGVDVFLFVSAFLITGQFVGRYGRDSRQTPAEHAIGLVRHWLHLFKRLLPAVVVVVFAILAAGAVILPETRWKQLADHALASAAYAQNWLLASESVDYYAQQSSTASPFQHFWSLSIQGQVFILWPLALVAVAWASRRFGLDYRGMLLLLFAGVFAASFAFSVWETGADQAYAYFDTRARLWEFALGSLLALVLPAFALPRWFRVLLGWAGVAAMLACGIVLQVDQAFPGYVALWPTLSAAAVIVAGATGSRAGADRFLSARPLVRLGDISYALYLWHWPVLVLGLAWAGADDAGWLGGLAVVAVSLVLAAVTTRCVEKPLRTLPALEKGLVRPAAAIAVSLALVAVPALVWKTAVVRDAAERADAAGPEFPGAESVFGQPTPEVERFAPALGDLEPQWPEFAECTGDPELDTRFCSNGVTDPARTVLVLGSSHPYTWATPLLNLAAQHGWRVETATRGRCPLTRGADPDPFVPADCADWQQERVQEAIADPPDVVVTTSTRAAHAGRPGEYLDSGWADLVGQLDRAGIPVVAIRDNPRALDRTVFGAECVAAHLDDPSVCTIPRGEAYAEADPAAPLRPPAAHLVPGLQRRALPGRHVPLGDRERRGLQGREPPEQGVPQHAHA
ncbi:acyltransferase family protein [Sinomonas halotolerans]|uniref:Acyltransferase family protein n=1 Tax=Sinomonas halotolerans TaxID=1644133 RepID=A0ABU9X1S1_9MICC